MRAAGGIHQLGVLVALTAAAATPPPNIVFIFADDLGYNEMGFQNSTRGLRTPALDALAADGVVLKKYYVQPICSPTRSAFMTGRYPIRLGTQANVICWDTPWAISAGEKFLPECLKDVGYATAMFGKWHLGMFREAATPPQRGFDDFEGYLQGCGSLFTHVSSCCAPGSPTNDEAYACADALTGFIGYDWFKGNAVDASANHTPSAARIRDRAVDYIHARAADDTPFFLYLPFQNVHSPYTTSQHYFDAFAGRGLNTATQTMWGYLLELDEAVGAVVDALRAHDAVYRNTIIVFSTDNGAPNAAGVADRNYPLRSFKARIYEGGTRGVAFIHSPLLPTAVRGTTSDKMYHVTDWLPTLAGLAGVDAGRAAGRVLDGVDIWSSLTTAAPSPRDEILYNINPLCNGGQAAAPKAGVRVGDMKLLVYCYDVAGVDGKEATGPVAAPRPVPRGVDPALADGPVLYNLTADPGEEVNLASRPAYAGTVAALLAALERHASNMVEPMQWNPPYQGPAYECAACPKHPAAGAAGEPWEPWL